MPIPRPSESILVDRAGADPTGILSLYERSGVRLRSLGEGSFPPARVIVLVGPDQRKLDDHTPALAPGGTLVVVGSPAEDASLYGFEFVLAERDVVFVQGDEP